MMDAKSLVLIIGHHYVVNESNIEEGYARFNALIGRPIDYGAFCDAVATCLCEGLIHEPIRLPEGALQCHWHLELTPKGVAAARLIVMVGEGRPSTSFAPKQNEVVDGRVKPGHDD